MPLKLTEAEIESGRSKKGGFTRAQLAKWGVHWPPPHGWRKALLAGEKIPSPNTPDKSRTPIERSKPLAPFSHDVLRQVVVAVINAGHASDLYDFPDILEYFGARADARPTSHVNVGDLLGDPDKRLADFYGIPL